MSGDVPALPMVTPRVERLRRVLPGVWAGALMMVAFVVAPSLFALLDRPLAGQVAARLFSIEAQISLALCVLMGWLERARGARRSAEGHHSRVSAELLLVLLALFCTVLGHYALQPAMAAARVGQSWLSFGALHAASTAFFGFKILAIATLAWRGSQA